MDLKAANYALEQRVSDQERKIEAALRQRDKYKEKSEQLAHELMDARHGLKSGQEKSPLQQQQDDYRARCEADNLEHLKEALVTAKRESAEHMRRGIDYSDAEGRSDQVIPPQDPPKTPPTKRERMSKLLKEKASLLNTGAYSPHDAVIVSLNEQIQQLACA